jgi:hypothetical protein
VKSTSSIFASAFILGLCSCGGGGAAGTAGGGGGVDGGGGGGGSAGIGGGGGGDPGISIAFAEPSNGALVKNPVLFRIESHGVDEVEVFADETYSLGPAWDPADHDWLLYRFAGTGIPRPLHVVGRKGGADVARRDISITVEPDSCEDRFFVSEFDEHNVDPSGSLNLTVVRENALAALKDAVGDLQACGAKVTLGGMMSLLLYEGALRACAFNTLCEENSYNKTATDCDLVPEALYSYQFGLGTIHTSNFHPCKGGAYTAGMRQRFLDEAAAAGFVTDPGLVTPEIAARFQKVCPGGTPSAVDYYLLGAHDIFGIPKDAKGNHLEAYAKFPLFSPGVSIRVTFAELSSSCATIDSDNKAIAIYGGGDPSYGDPAKQATILSLYKNFEAASCK